MLALILVCASLLSMVSCAAPKIDEVRDIFIELVESSSEVNRILFGDGLSVYGDLSYDEASKTYYCIFYNEEYGKLLAYYDSESHEYITLRFASQPDADDWVPVYKDEEKGKFSGTITIA